MTLIIVANCRERASIEASLLIILAGWRSEPIIFQNLMSDRQCNVKFGPARMQLYKGRATPDPGRRQTG